MFGKHMIQCKAGLMWGIIYMYGVDCLSDPCGIVCTEVKSENLRSSAIKCEAAAATLNSSLLIGEGLENNGVSFDGYPVIGPNQLMETSGGCQNSPDLPPNVPPSQGYFCSWDPRPHGLFYHETSIYVPLSNISSFIMDVKALRDVTQASSLCGIDEYDGLLMRFTTHSDAYLGNPEDGVEVRHSSTNYSHYSISQDTILESC
jgi:hypothetical protein